MTPRIWVAIACLVGGIVLAAWALAERQLLLALGGFALIFTALYLLIEKANEAMKPKHPITPAADAAWNMKDRPADAQGRERDR